MIKPTVAVNLLWVSTQDKTGAFIYLVNLLDRLLPLDTETKFWLISRQRDERFLKRRYGRYPNVGFYVCDFRADLCRRPLRALGKLWRRWRHDEAGLEKSIARELNELMERRQIKKMFFPNQLIYPRGLARVEQFVTILDLQHEYLPENFSAREIANRRANLSHIAGAARRLLAISEYTKQTLVEKLGLPAAKIVVTPLGPDEQATAPEAINLAKPFLFYPAALWPHKNHQLAIEVLRRLAAKHPTLQLVFSGLIKKPKLKTELEKLTDDYQLTDRVHWLGFVSDAAIAWLYQNAALMIFPSRFEGFGMPILEAYRHHLPVVAARNTSLTEVAGDAALLCETDNIAAFTAAVERVLGDSQSRQKMIVAGIQQLTRFSWQQTAQTTLAAMLDK